MSLLEYRKHLPQDTTAFAKSGLVKTSTYKATLVADLIRNMKASEATLQLRFCKKKVAEDMLKVLNAAIANAENNHSLDIDTLYVSEIYVERGPYLKRFTARARGRGSRILKPFSRIVVFVTEKK